MLEPQTTVQQKQTQEQRVKVSGAAMGTWLNTLITWAVIFIIALILVGISLWIFGGLAGRAIDISVIVTLLLTLGFYLWTWGAGRLYDLDRRKLNSNVIETQHVSVFMYDNGEYVNFTAEVARAANPGLPPEPVVIPQYVPPSFDERADYDMWRDKTGGMVWDSIAEKHYTTVAKARTGVKRHEQRMLDGSVHGELNT